MPAPHSLSREGAARPFKAYEVYTVVDYGFCTKEYSLGIHAGRTPGQARAHAVRDRSDGVNNPWRGLRSRRAHGPAADEVLEQAEDAGKHWRSTKRYARLQAAADAFNAAWPVGTPVEVPGCCWGYGWPEQVTFTRTPAWVSCGLQLYVSVEGLAGGLDLARVVPLIEPAAPTLERKEQAQ